MAELIHYSAYIVNGVINGDHHSHSILRWTRKVLTYLLLYKTEVNGCVRGTRTSLEKFPQDNSCWRLVVWSDRDQHRNKDTRYDTGGFVL